MISSMEFSEWLLKWRIAAVIIVEDHHLIVCFRKLLKNHSDDYDEERRANLIAVITQLHAMGIHQVSALSFLYYTVFL